MEPNESKFEAVFETEIVITKDTISEILWKTITKSVLIIAGIVLLGCIASIIGGHYDAIVGIVLVIFFLLGVIFIQKREVNLQVQRMKELEGEPELNLGISFGSDNIRTRNLRRGGEVFLDYDAIIKFMETKNYYVLRTVAKHNIIVEKATLIQTQQEEAFLLFIKEKCKKVKICERKIAQAT